MRTILWILSSVSMAGGAGTVTSWDFDALATGSLPKGWRVQATGQQRPTAKWRVWREEDAPLGPGVLELAASNHSESGVFNLCWTDRVSFHEGEIAVFLRARSGKIELKDGWHLLKISHRGDRVRVYLDGEMRLSANAGNHVPGKGGVGLWTKADAATAFDNFTVVSR